MAKGWSIGVVSPSHPPELSRAHHDDQDSTSTLLYFQLLHLPAPTLPRHPRIRPFSSGRSVASLPANLSGTKLAGPAVYVQTHTLSARRLLSPMSKHTLAISLATEKRRAKSSSHSWSDPMVLRQTSETNQRTRLVYWTWIVSHSEDSTKRIK
jgi:hypothetical protein